jgi:hypothetical protein
MAEIKPSDEFAAEPSLTSSRPHAFFPFTCQLPRAFWKKNHAECLQRQRYVVQNILLPDNQIACFLGSTMNDQDYSNMA